MRSSYIEKGAFERLLSSMPIKTALAVRVCLETGIRVGDCVALRQCNIVGQTLTYKAQKTGKKDKKTLTRALVRDLREYGGTDLIFESKRSKSGHISRQTVYKGVKRAARLAGETANVTPHSARKIYAVEMRKAVGMKETQRLLQHSNAETTALYAFSDVALGGAISAAEFDRIIDEIATRTARKVIKALFGKKRKTP